MGQCLRQCQGGRVGVSVDVSPPARESRIDSQMTGHVLSDGTTQAIDTRSKECQALAVSPTRELAEQARHVIMAFGDLMNVRCHACIGGKSVGEDIRTLEAGVQVVSGTPGRIYDMIKRQALKTKAIKMLVIDEADEMLSKGFKDQIYDIYRYLPPKTQVTIEL